MCILYPKTFLAAIHKNIYFQQAKEHCKSRPSMLCSIALLGQWHQDKKAINLFC